MNDSTVKQTRQILRQVQSHLMEAHLYRGAEQEQVGLVEVLHHPASTTPELNYVTPRKNTAWVSMPEVMNGLKILKGHERALRVMFIEGLFIPAFGDRLSNIGLARESEVRVMALQLDPTEIETMSPDEFDSDQTMSMGTTTFINVSSRAESALWWYLWRNAHYDVVTQTAELRFIDSSYKQIADGHQLDLIMRVGGIPAGVVSLTLSADRTSAQISAFALARETRSLPHAQQLLEAVIDEAKARGISLLFFAEADVLLNTAGQALGFMDCGGIVCYSEANDPFHVEGGHDTLAAALHHGG
jgi:ribosomal protein S18 acetylase RimI-like enzyme